MVKVVIGVILGAGLGMAGNYLCKVTGGACPLMSNKLVSVVLWALIGGLIGASMWLK